jgi:hypothetical protein
MRVSVLFVSLLASANAFTTPVSSRAAFGVVSQNAAPTIRNNVQLTMAAPEKNSESSSNIPAPMVPAMTAAMWAALSSSAMAAGPDWGLFEGRTGSLLHPVMMFGMLALSVSTALLGFDWRRQRTIGDDINDLKKKLPDLGGASTVAEALTAAKAAETPDSAYIAKLESATSIESEIKELQATRKELAAKGPRDQHFSQGALLAFLGTAFAIEVRVISDETRRNRGDVTCPMSVLLREP